MANVIEVQNLTKFYGHFFWKQKVAALDDLTLSIPEGAVFGFLGPNGAGKTTTIRLLMDLIRPSSGTATILGKPPDDVEVKRLIGFLPDAPAFSSTAIGPVLLCQRYCIFSTTPAACRPFRFVGS